MVLLRNPKEFNSAAFNNSSSTESTTNIIISDYENDDDTSNFVDALNNLDSSNILNDTNNNNDESIERNINMRRRNKHKKRAANVPKAIDFNKGDGKRTKGSRHARRYENMCYLLSLVDQAEIDFDSEITYEDIVRPKMSAFARLMFDESSLEIWNDFLSRSGQEQDEIIEYAELLHKKSKKNKAKRNRYSSVISDDFVYCNEESLDESFEKSGEYEIVRNEYTSRKTLDKDKKLVYGEYLFSKIDRNIRDVLKRKVAIDKLFDYEDTLVSTFSVSPDSVYVNNIPNSYDRMILHGICQYMDLNSKSFDKNGERHTIVENNKTLFKLPTILLSEYLQVRFLQ